MIRAREWEVETMMREPEILGRFVGLRRETLQIWIDRGWVVPERGQRGYKFREIDVARVGLIHEFSTTLALDDDAMDVVLPLLDQVHGLRQQLRRLADAVSRQPDDVRQKIAQAVAENSE